VLPLEQESDAARRAWLAADEPVPLETKHHLVDSRATDAEEPLHVSLGRRPAIHQRVGIDEGKVLSLPCGEARSRII
jgi:hypothetical protein